MAVTNARMVWSELLVLNGDGRPTKREELETSLDSGIVTLSRLTRQLKRTRRRELRTIVDTLRVIRDYRLRFPRSNPANPEISEQARKVLSMQ